jgi:hypothetical protein
VAEDKRQWSQADTIAMALVTAVAGVIRGIHLSMPADLFGDEIFYAREACIYVVQISGLQAVGRHCRARWLVLEVKSIYCPSGAPRHREVQQRRCR